MKYSCHVYNNFIRFWYDFIRTNPTDAVFSRIAMMLFYVQKTKVLRMGWKFTENIFGKYKNKNVHAKKEEIWKDKIGNNQQQKFGFYHLLTRGRVGVKLGDADTSPSYL